VRAAVQGQPGRGGLIFSLSVAQTAATLAATFVGLKLGLFDTSVVNAVMIVIVAGVLASSRRR